MDLTHRISGSYSLWSSLLFLLFGHHCFVGQDASAAYRDLSAREVTPTLANVDLVSRLLASHRGLEDHKDRPTNYKSSLPSQLHSQATTCSFENRLSWASKASGLETRLTIPPPSPRSSMPKQRTRLRMRPSRASFEG